MSYSFAEADRWVTAPTLDHTETWTTKNSNELKTPMCTYSNWFTKIWK